MVLPQPVPPPPWPRFISTVRVLTSVQVALVMVCGNCSFGWPLLATFTWATERFDWHEDAVGFAVLWAWVVGFAAMLIYASFTIRWAGLADRRARAAIIVGTAVLVAFTAASISLMGGDPPMVGIILITATPSLIVQLIVLRCVYGREGRRWFEHGPNPSGPER
ncbi:hypothetical protein GCM10009853_044540 [Glycomyces scopariae]